MLPSRDTESMVFGLGSGLRYLLVYTGEASLSLSQGLSPTMGSMYKAFLN